MKVRINISISEEAVKLADASGNRSQYIEDLILGTHGSPELENSTVLSEQRVREIINEVLRHKNKIASSPTARSAKDVLAEIQAEKAKLDDLLEFNQDPEDHKTQEKIIQDLWTEYHSLKEQDEGTEV